MKKSGIFSFILIIFLIASLSAVYAEEELSDSEMVDNAYDCLNKIIDNKGCSAMPLEELIYSTMATGACDEELKDKAQKSDGELECWPKGSCDIKTTAEAMIALDLLDSESKKIQEWFDTKKVVPKEVEWFLQIDTDEESTCSITYDTKDYSTKILESKKVSGSAGACLSPSDNGFWLKINENCFEKEFQISCEKKFITTLLYREKDQGDKTIHVSKAVSSEPEGGIAIEQIQSFCFGSANSCDYEGSLWAISALGRLDYRVLPFLPYLVTAKESNKAIFSQPLLYILTGYDNYKMDILNRQISNEYWNAQSGKFYDTAFALLPFVGINFEEKSNAINWLKELQDDDGCWDDGDIATNSFIVSSIWPRYWTGIIINQDTPANHTNDTNDTNDTNETDECEFDIDCNYADGETCEDGICVDDSGTTTVVPDNDCELSGYYCDNTWDRTEDFMSDYSCVGSFQKCYEKEGDVVEEYETCATKYPDSDTCSVNEICAYNSKLVGTETCCIGEECQIASTEDPESTECVDADGYCSNSCYDGDAEDSYYSDSCDEVNSGDICCFYEEDPTPQKSFVWLWVLFVLIILATIAIIYRDKLREEFLKLKSRMSGEPEASKTNQREQSSMNHMRNRRIIPGRPNTIRRAPMLNRPSLQRPTGVKPALRKPIPGKPIPGKPIPGNFPQKPSPQNSLPQKPLPQKPRAKSPEELDDVLRKLKDMSK